MEEDFDSSISVSNDVEFDLDFEDNAIQPYL